MLDDGGQRVGGGRPFEGRNARQQLVQNGSQGELVGAKIHALAPRLLGRHVGQRPQDDSLARHLAVQRHHPGRDVVVARREFRETEIRDLRRSGPGDQNVFGLQVPVHDSFFMSLGEPGRDLAGEIENSLDTQRRTSDERPKIGALDELGHQETDLGLLADVEDRHDVGAGQGRGGASFALESLPTLGIPAELFRQYLDSHFAAEANVPRPVHFSHASGAERSDDFVRTQARAGRQTHPDPILAVLNLPFA